MSTAVIPNAGSFTTLDTAATPNTGVLRDSQGNIAGAQVSGSEVKTTGTTVSKLSATKTTGFTADATASIWPCDATGGAFAPLLPLANSCPGRMYRFVKIDASANAVTVTRSGSDTIGGGAGTTKALASQDASVTVISDGTSKWLIV
jgi:hypothetical protein